MEPIKPVKIKENMKISELVESMSGMGFGAGKVGKAKRIMQEMFEDKECKVFLGVAGAMVPAGMKEIILDMLDDVDVFVTTGANLTHDLIEALGEKHYHAEESFDDEELHEKGLDRIYNVLMKNDVYEKLEDFFEKHFDEFSKCGNVKEFLWKIGEVLSKCPTRPPESVDTYSSEQDLPVHSRSQIDNVDNKKTFLDNDTSVQSSDEVGLGATNSILQKCYEKKIPIFCPGIADSGIGLMMWGRIAAGKGKTNIDVFSDMNEIIDASWTAKKTGVIYVGGGLPKNFIQQSMQFSKGANYGIQITTDRMEPGGSSGAPLKEGISWGKMQKDGNFVDVFCDATIALPLIYGAVKC